MSWKEDALSDRLCPHDIHIHNQIRYIVGWEDHERQAEPADVVESVVCQKTRK